MTAFTEIPDNVARSAIVLALFGQHVAVDKDLERYRQYFSYYDHEISELQKQINKPGWEEKVKVIGNHNDMLKVLKHLQEQPGLKRDEMRDRIEGMTPNVKKAAPDKKKAALDWAISITMRLCLMINIPDEGFGSPGDPTREVEWSEKSLKDWLASLTPPPMTRPSSIELREDPRFNVAFLVVVCGLKIRWTNSLQEHLRIRYTKPSGRRELAIFSHKAYLAALLNNSNFQGQEHCGPWPKSVLRETLDSLILLFPANDSRTESILNVADSHDRNVGRRWAKAWLALKRLLIWSYPDADIQDIFRFARRNVRDINPYTPVSCTELKDFNHWLDRLIALRQEVYLAPAVGWRQLFLDDRNPQQYWTFWLALVIFVLTVFSTAFSAIATILGAISTVTGWVSMRIAQQEASAIQTVFCEVDITALRGLFSGVSIGRPTQTSSQN